MLKVSESIRDNIQCLEQYLGIQKALGKFLLDEWMSESMNEYKISSLMLDIQKALDTQLHWLYQHFTVFCRDTLPSRTVP